MTSRDRLTKALAAAAAIAVLALGVGGAEADTTPTYHPAGLQLDTTAYSLRFSGADRYATAGSVAMFSAVSGEQGMLPVPLPIPGFEGVRTGYPFNDPDASDDATAFGNGACPDAVGIAAADTPADVLASSSAWNATLTGAAVTSGGPTSVDIGPGVMLLAAPNRTGTNPDLPDPTVAALVALRAECTAFDAVIFGGTNAVGPLAASTVDSIATNVIRVAGADRFGTARLIAEAVGAATVTDHPSAAGGAVDLGPTVALAEAFTGADALALGPFAAGNNVPVLLTPSGTLAPETRNALLALNPQTVLVLGGTTAITDATATAAGAAGSATVVRVAGVDRYDTSVKIAERLYDLYGADAGGATFSNLLVGVARSDGSGAAHAGWPDALSSAWMMATWWNGGDGTQTPTRLAPPVEQNAGDNFIGGASISLPPLLLTTRAAMPASVSTYLVGLYPSAADIQTASTPTDVNDGGFAFVFGGTEAVAGVQELGVAVGLSGGTYTLPTRSDLVPTQNRIFYTDLVIPDSFRSEERGGVDDGSSSPGPYACAYRGDLEGGEFLAVRSTTGVFRRTIQIDYQNDAQAYAPQASRFMCVDVKKLDSEPSSAATLADVFSVSLSGHRTVATRLNWVFTETLNAELAGPVAPTTSQGAFPVVDVVSGSSAATYTYADAPMGTTNFRGTAYNVGTGDIAISVERSDGPGTPGTDDRITVTGSISFSSGTSEIWSATFVGEGVADPSAPETFIGRYVTDDGKLGAFTFQLSAAGAVSALRFAGNG